MITRYDPLHAPNPDEWLALDESERIHLVVEYQIACGDEYPVQEAQDRLVKEGLDRHEAIHAIGSVLIKYLWEVGSGENISENFTDDYFEEIRRLTAQKWFDEFG